MEKQNLRIRLLTSWGRWSIVHWKEALLIVLGITLIMIYGASRVQSQMTYYSILPSKEKNVQDLKEIIKNFPMASGIIAVIDGRKIKNPAEAEKQVKATIDALERELNKASYKKYIIRTSGKTDISLFKEHGLMLTKSEDIKRFAEMFKSLNFSALLHNINNDFEKEYSGNEEKLSLDENFAVSQFKGLDNLVHLMEKAASGKKVSNAEVNKVLGGYLYGDSYLLSNDNRMGLLIIEPNFTIDTIGKMTKGVSFIEKGVKSVAAAHGLKAGLTGLTVVGRDEMETSQQGLAVSSTIALLLILALMIFAFRMFSAPLISGTPLVVGIIWTIGLTGFTIQRLNIVTAMYMVALLGLGIDYAIHLLTAFVQERDGGVPFKDAVLNSLGKSGNGIIIGALTTAAAFFMLSFSKTEMISELGIVAGLGIISELVVMIMMIPPLLSWRNSRVERKGKGEHKLFARININSHAASGLGNMLVKKPYAVMLVMILVITGFSFFAGKISIEQNIMNMEKKGLESIKLQDEMVKEFGMAPDVMSIISSNLDEIKSLSTKLKKLSSVKRVESIVPYVTIGDEVKVRTPEIKEFKMNIENTRSENSGIDNRKLLYELNRLEDNFLELSDLAYLGNMDKIAGILSHATGRNSDGVKVGTTAFDSLGGMLEKGPVDERNLEHLQNMVRDNLAAKLTEMTSLQPVTLDMVPAVMRDSFVSSDGSKFLLNIVPTKNPWKGDFRKIYESQIKSVTDKATGMVLAGDVLTIMAREDGVRSSLGAVLVIFIIILIDFRNVKLAFLTMIPLAASFLVLFGIMGIFNIKFDFVNIIAVPLLIGIGIDDAVHINHRYLLEGKGSMARVIGKTGTALLLTSLTTIIGFASFIPSPMRAMKSTGIVLSLAMAIAFINSVLLHPAVLIVAAEKLKLNINPWRKGDKKHV